MGELDAKLDTPLVRLEVGELDVKLDTPSVKLEVGASDNPDPPLPPVLGTKDEDPELVPVADGLAVVPSSVTVLDPLVVGPNDGYAFPPELAIGDEECVSYNGVGPNDVFVPHGVGDPLLLLFVPKEVGEPLVPVPKGVGAPLVPVVSKGVGTYDVCPPEDEVLGLGAEDIPVCVNIVGGLLVEDVGGDVLFIPVCMTVGDDDEPDNEEEVLGVGDKVFPIPKEEVGDVVDEPGPFDDELLGVGDILFPVPKGVGGAVKRGPLGEELLVPDKKGVGRLDDASPPASTVGDGLPLILLVELAGIVGE